MRMSTKFVYKTPFSVVVCSKCAMLSKWLFWKRELNEYLFCKSMFAKMVISITISSWSFLSCSFSSSFSPVFTFQIIVRILARNVCLAKILVETRIKNVRLALEFDYLHQPKVGKLHKLECEFSLPIGFKWFHENWCELWISKY